MQTTEVSDEAPQATVSRLRWWKELLIIGTFYVLYSFARNRFGSTLVDKGDAPQHSFDNAMRVVRIERALHLFVEPTVQGWFLSYHWFIRAWNIYYGTFHFIVTAGVMVFLFVWHRGRYARWRTVLGFTTALAIVGFSLFPLMPPRLLNAPPRYGGEPLATEEFGFVDTMKDYGGLWSFDSKTMQTVTNQYAAMPSLHVAWSLWCVAAVWGVIRKRWARYLLVLYPLATLFCIIVTANHYWLDGIGGVLTFLVGFVVGTAFQRWCDERRLRQAV
jgi:hypothetical protein